MSLLTDSARIIAGDIRRLVRPAPASRDKLNLWPRAGDTKRTADGPATWWRGAWRTEHTRDWSITQTTAPGPAWTPAQQRDVQRARQRRQARSRSR